MPCEAALPVPVVPISRARRFARPRSIVDSLGRDPAWLTEAGPPARTTPAVPNTEGRPRLGAELLRWGPATLRVLH